MKVKVYLITNVKGLGNAKSIVSVSRGYALNYLIPKGFAKIINEGLGENISQEVKDIEEKKETFARKQKEVLESKTLNFKGKAGEGEKLFGSITTSEIAEKIRGVFGLDIDKKKIELESPIKKLGNYIVTVKLYKDVDAKVNISVEKE